MTAMKTQDAHACLCSRCYREDPLALLRADRSPDEDDYISSQQQKDVLELRGCTGSAEKCAFQHGHQLAYGWVLVRLLPLSKPFVLPVLPIAFQPCSRG